MKNNGSLTIGVNLLFDVVFFGWLAFAGLYSLEVLLPTFVTARLSLVKLSLLLIGLTTILAALGKILSPEKKNSDHLQPTRGFLLLIGTFVLSLLTIAHYRFPWWSIIFSVGGYSFIAFLVWRTTQSK